MKISTRSRYGLRLLAELARRGGVQTQVAELAAAQDIPPAYAAKLVDPLRAAGLVKSARGLGGGISLSRRAADIRVLEAVEALEGDLSLVDCLTNGADRDCLVNCPTHRLWEDLENLIKGFLAEQSLQDLAVKESPVDYCI